MPRNFALTPARREAVPLLISLTGPSGSGKTTSALRLATGIQKVVGGEIAVIDTENRRALHYADKFDFKHMQFDPPFASLDYLEAMQQAVRAGAKVIVIDSMSHEHSAEGGMLDAHEAELSRLAGSDYQKRERMTMLAWQKPKAARRKLLQGITRLDAHVILCFRAREVSKPIKNDKGRVEIVQMGFTPDAGPEFVYECALSAIFLPNSDGVPSWNPENIGERQAVKIPDQFRWLKEYKGAMDEGIGERLAKWAQGSEKQQSTIAQKVIKKSSQRPLDEDDPNTLSPAEQKHLELLEEKLTESAKLGSLELRLAWQRLSESDRIDLDPTGSGCPTIYKEIAAEADKGNEK